MLTTIAYIALILGIVLVVLGYTVEPRALRPGWAALILAVVLILIGLLLPHGHAYYDTTPNAAGSALLPGP